MAPRTDLEVLLELVKYGRRLADVAPFKDMIGGAMSFRCPQERSVDGAL